MAHSPVNHGDQWRISFGMGCATWFLWICVARGLPPALQGVFGFLPIGFFTYAVYTLPYWQREGKRQDLIDSLIEREQAHTLMLRHHLNLASQDVDFAIAHKELRLMVDPDPIPEPEPEALQAITFQQKIHQIAGESGWKLTTYLMGSGAKHADDEGWISVDKIRANWAKDNGLTKQQLVDLLTLLTQEQIGQWRNSDLSEWRFLVSD